MTHFIKQWQNYIVYQIYPLSFMDSNGDGVGDIQGIILKLDYLKNLGIDVIWLSPIYMSPMDDNGYDISDYYQINPMFGTISDFKQLLEKVHRLGMKLIMDLVVNHTSDEHTWFLESKKSKENPYRDYYIWRDQPSEITSVFSGSAWEYDSSTNQYYFHLFSKKQPDLNWDNPLLRLEIYRMINFWLDFGIDGFRLDVIDLIGKDVDRKLLGDGPHLDERLKELYQNCFEGRDVFTVGEMPTLSIPRAAEVTSLQTGTLNMIFQFGHVSLDEVPGRGKWELKQLDLLELKEYFNKMQIGLYEEGWNSLFLANHDQPRAVSRYGNIAFRKESATMLATMLYSMQGTPYVYQGEEIGMTGVKFESLDEYRDIETLNMAKEYLEKGWSKEKTMESIYAKSRDNSRTPMQWSNQPNSGFTTGRPWLNVNPNYHEINVENDLSDTFSIYRYFQKLFQLRKKYSVFADGKFHLLFEDSRDLFIFTRSNDSIEILVINSFSPEPVSVNLDAYSKYQFLLSNNKELNLNASTVLPPYYAGIYISKETQYQL
ncbi:MAG: alpha-glucosidase [Firmicutes bacterium]|nr:alpha-glucosidase [Bacillota bacterium]